MIRFLFGSLVIFGDLAPRSAWTNPALSNKSLSHSLECNLTPPSSGRPKGRFAPVSPPLMSNVRRQRTRRHAGCDGSPHVCKE